MTDAELIARLRDWEEHDEGKINDAREEAAARIEALTKERDEQIKWVKRLADDLIAAEAKLAKAVATERARIVKLLDGIDRTELDDNGWWETSFGAKFGEGILNAILKGENHD